VKIPCEKCKAIRRFSGEPLRCGVCGWECAAASPVKTENVAQAKAEDTWSGDKKDRAEDGGGEEVWRGEHKLAAGALLKVVMLGMLFLGTVYLLAQYLAPGKHPEILTPGKYQLALKYGLTEDQVFMDEKPKGCNFSDEPPGEKHCHFEQSLNVVRTCVEAKCPVDHVYVSWRKVKD
jgi:hypothetical protein